MGKRCLIHIKGKEKIGLLGNKLRLIAVYE